VSLAKVSYAAHLPWHRTACFAVQVGKGLELVLRGEMKMKLNLLFFIMDLLTILAYPFVFLHGKLRQFSKS